MSVDQVDRKHRYGLIAASMIDLRDGLKASKPHGNLRPHETP